MTLRFSSRIAIPSNDREVLAKTLNQVLADSVDLKMQVKQAHWNIRGRHFIARHELFDDLAMRLDGFIDEVAERAAAMGALTRGCVRDVASNTRLAAYDHDATNGMQLVRMLADRYGAYTKNVRDAVSVAEERGDVATEDLLTEMVRTTEIDLWFLESHLEG